MPSDLNNVSSSAVERPLTLPVSTSPIEPRMWSSPTAPAAFAAKFGRAELPVEAIASAEDAVRRGDVICTLTAAIDPVLFGRWLAPGSHVNAVGAGTPAQAELDTDAVKRCRMFADYKDSALALGGEFHAAGTIHRHPTIIQEAEAGDVQLDRMAPGPGFR